jgi:DNA-binding XRE family transcriptional regulator
MSTTIGRRIAMIRAHRMMTQTALAAAIGESRHVMANIEHGQTKVDIERGERIAAALHCTEADIREPLDAPMPRIRFRGARPFPRAGRGAGHGDG